jgi:hypothetical protein
VSGRVIYFPMVYLPSELEFERLANIQKEIQGWRAYLVTEWNQKNFNEGERYLSKVRFHNGIRQQWKIIEGLKLDDQQKERLA